MRKHPRTWQRWGLRILFLLYLAVLLRITVFRPGFGQMPPMQGSWNDTLFAEYLPLLQNGRWLRFVYLFVGNLVWFVPLGMAVQCRTRRRLWPSAAAGLALSAIIEAGQYLFGTGVSELDDLVLNTAGALIGAAAVLLLRRLRGRGQTSAQAGEKPSR